ncbi:hypothetical protein DFH08DRAFT_900102 [Mycena albidolilacea]|uniref:RING-type domain-containing protein n=1 Tax=Mycena albidolilacea TaxID=1033008 RepID=A0AAD6Z5M7_9AGAR|nr:hypothetical protein DFH08DRAFT_900102 [Mycena albidolilacea]
MSRPERGGTVPKSRSKSRSPSRTGSGSRSDPFTLSTTAAAPTVKRKRSSSVGTSTAPAAEDIDRGQRIKPKPSSSMQNRVLLASGPSSSVRPKKERERARSAQMPTTVPPVERRGLDKGKSRHGLEIDASSPPPTPVYSGPLAAAEYERMRKELETLKETLKRTVHEGKKQLKKQNKTIEELRAQVTTETLAREETDKLLVAASSKARKHEELESSLLQTLTCQICIELLTKPNVLAPCGHIFCLECLQQWFRSAPGTDSDDDMNVEEREQYILHRAKSCPCCRTRVLRRPVPVFVVKSVVTALRSASAQPIAAQPVAAQEEEDVDPWKGLFLPDYESSEGDDEDLDGYASSEAEFYDHYSEEDLDDLDHAAEMALALGLSAFPQDLTRFYASASESEDGSASDSDMEEEQEEEGEAEGAGARAEEEEEEEEDSDSDPDATYSLPHWEPPSHIVEFENISRSVWKMQRRGCTPQLIALFNMRYTHDEGLIAHISSLNASEDGVGFGRNRLFLGWNIDVELADEDVEGEAEKAYIVRQLRDIRRHPERWMLAERRGYPGRGIMDARRLAPVQEDPEVYDTSDSEAYSNGDDFL